MRNSRKQDPEKRDPVTTAAAPPAIAGRPTAPLAATTPAPSGVMEPASRGPVDEPLVVPDVDEQNTPVEETKGDQRPVVVIADPDTYYDLFW